MAQVSAQPQDGVTEDGSDEERLVAQSSLAKLLTRPEVGAFIGAAAVFLIFSFAASSSFPTFTGFVRYTESASHIGIMAAFVSLLMISGEFDLSSGIMTGSAGLTFTLLAGDDIQGTNIWVGLVASLLLAIAIGFFNGYMVIKTKLPSFIITLGSAFGLFGANIALTKSIAGGPRTRGIKEVPGAGLFDAVLGKRFNLSGLPLIGDKFDFLDQNIQIAFFWWILATIIGAYVLSKTSLGNWIQAIGGDAEAARGVGVPVDRVKIGLFVATSCGAWLVGLIQAFENNGVTANAGQQQEFIYIIAAVIGGCLLTGGYGSVVGAAIGALVFGMTRTGVTFAGWNADWFWTFLGVMLLTAVLINSFVSNQAKKVRAK